MKKWKKFLIPAMCLFLVQAPASVFASAAISCEANICEVSDENIQPAAASSSRVKKVVMKNGRYYLYQGKTKRKTAGIHTREEPFILAIRMALLMQHQGWMDSSRILL